MLVTALRWICFLAVFASGAVFAYADHGVGFLVGMVASAGIVILMSRDHIHLVEDRHEAHQRLLDLNDYTWVMDKLVMITERDRAPKKLRDEAKRLAKQVQELAAAEPTSKTDDLKFS